MKASLTLVAAFGCCLLDGLPAGAIALRIIPLPQPVQIGSSVSVAIAISELGTDAPPSLGAFDLDVNFANSILQYQSVVFGDELSLFGILSLSGESLGLTSVNLYESSQNTPSQLNNSQAANFHLATLTFQATGLGTSSLNFANVILGDANGNLLTADLLGGSVKVFSILSPTVPEPSLFPALLAIVGIGVSGLCRKK